MAAANAHTVHTAYWRRCLRGLAWLALTLTALPALAVDYVFPGKLPPGCRGSAGSYNCGSLTLNIGDTLTIASPKPATISFSGNFDTQISRINATGAAADLRLQVSGNMTVRDTAVVNANIVASLFETTGGGSTITGNVSTTAGIVSLAARSRITGSVSASGNALIGQEAVITGDLVSTGGNVVLGFEAHVDGNVTVSAGQAVTLAQNAVVGGAVTASAGDVKLGFEARVGGNITTTSGRIDLGQAAVASACVRSSASAPIVLNYAASAAQVCCGTTGSCGSGCVDNRSGLALPALCTVPATLIARYDFNESAYNGSAGQLKDSAGYTGGPFNGATDGAGTPTTARTGPARSGSPGTCGYASLPGPTSNGGSFLVTGLPVSTIAGAKTSVAFWMYWDGTEGVMPMGWHSHDLWLTSGSFGFNTGNTDVHGVASAGLANGWRHVVAVFTNGSVTANRLYIDGTPMALTQRQSTPDNSTAVVASSMRIGGWTRDTGYRFGGRLDQFRVYTGEVSTSQVAQLFAETAPCATGSVLHHLELQHASGSGLTCTPSTVTVKACQDSACTIAYTEGLSGSLGASGSGMSVNWPAGAAFSIAAGSSSSTVGLQLSTAGGVLLGTSGLSVTPTAGTSCNFGSPACTYTAADAGLLFDVPHHLAEGVQALTVSAVRKSDNALSCVPAFASVSKSVSFSCAYGNPASGTLPVRLAGSALNSGNSAAAACDSAGRAVALAFNANGVASTTLQYADVGQVTLAARYTGAAGSSEAGLVMTGSDSFIAAPTSFTISGITSGPIKAGNAFSATVSARNAAAAITPNFARETAAESVTLGYVRIAPTGVGTVGGNFSGNLGAFNGGSATASNLVWTEVGRGDLVARLSSNSYLGSGLGAFGASAAPGAIFCANENGQCSLPANTTATIYYGANASYTVRTGRTNNVACNNSTFGDPLSGVANKCFYAVTSASNGSVGDFIPHHFDVLASAACGAFSYAGQPFGATVTARNAGGGATLNFDGAAAITPNFAQAVTLSDAGGSGLGTLSGASIAATAFTAGIAQASPAYAFTSKTTAPLSLQLRAANAGAGAAAISSAGYTEASMPLRSGRLRLSNAYGSARALLQVPVVAEHWGGSAWMLNSADNCTNLLSTSVVVSNPRTAAGLASVALSTPGVVSLTNGSGLLSLAAPLPLGSSLTLDLALNLGSGTADQSCHANHPLSVGAAKPWLRAQNGSCSASADRDPAARASFGIYSPESRKTVHVREMY